MGHIFSVRLQICLVCMMTLCLNQHLALILASLLASCHLTLMAWSLPCSVSDIGAFCNNEPSKKKAAVDHFILDGDCRSTSTDAHSKHNGGAISVSHLQSPGSRLLTCAASWHRWSSGHPWRCDQSSEVYIEPESVANILHYTCPMSSHVCIRALVKTHSDSTASDLNLALSARVDPLPFFTWRKLSRRLLSADSK